MAVSIFIAYVAQRKKRNKIVATINNPFVVYGYKGAEYFCDHEKETEKMMTSLHNERNITLVAPRRVGKTGLHIHTLHFMHACCRKQRRDASCAGNASSKLNHELKCMCVLFHSSHSCSVWQLGEVELNLIGTGSRSGHVTTILYQIIE